MTELAFWILWPVLLGAVAAGAMLLGRRIFPPTSVEMDEGLARSIAERTAGTIGRGVIEMMMRDRQIVRDHGLRRDEALAAKIDDMGRSIVHVAQAFETLADALSVTIATLNLRFGSKATEDPSSRAAPVGAAVSGRAAEHGLDAPAPSAAAGAVETA